MGLWHALIRWMPRDTTFEFMRAIDQFIIVQSYLRRCADSHRTVHYLHCQSSRGSWPGLRVMKASVRMGSGVCNDMCTQGPGDGEHATVFNGPTAGGGRPPPGAPRALPPPAHPPFPPTAPPLPKKMTKAVIWDPHFS